MQSLLYLDLGKLSESSACDTRTIYEIAAIFKIGLCYVFFEEWKIVSAIMLLLDPYTNWYLLHDSDGSRASSRCKKWKQGRAGEAKVTMSGNFPMVKS